MMLGRRTNVDTAYLVVEVQRFQFVTGMSPWQLSERFYSTHSPIY
jgi:hypothetical protein